MMSIDGRTLISLGLNVGRFDGHQAGGQRDYDEIRLPSVPGVFLLTPREGGREIALSAWVRGTDLSDTQSKLDVINWWIDRPDVREIELDAIPDRHLRAKLDRVAKAPIGPSLNTRIWSIDAVWRAGEPPWWLNDTLTEVTGIGVTPKDLPAGSAPIHYGFRGLIQGPATNPKLTFRTPASDVAAELAITGTLDSTPEYYAIDFELARLWKNTTGNYDEGTDAIDDFDPANGIDLRLTLDPAWWDLALSDWMTAECSSGTAKLRYPIPWR